MATLERIIGIERFIWDKVVLEKNSHEEVSSIRGLRGLSAVEVFDDSVASMIYMQLLD